MKSHYNQYCVMLLLWADRSSCFHREKIVRPRIFDNLDIEIVHTLLKHVISM